jgi:hypothetical protein
MVPWSSALAISDFASSFLALKQRVVVDHRHRAMGVMDQRSAHRPKQTTRQRSLTATTHHVHLHLFGQIHKGCNRRRPQDFAAHLEAIVALDRGVDDLDRIVNHLVGLVFLRLHTASSETRCVSRIACTT